MALILYLDFHQCHQSQRTKNFIQSIQNGPPPWKSGIKAEVFLETLDNGNVLKLFDKQERPGPKVTRQKSNKPPKNSEKRFEE